MTDRLGGVLPSTASLSVIIPSLVLEKILTYQYTKKALYHHPSRRYLHRYIDPGRLCNSRLICKSTEALVGSRLGFPVTPVDAPDFICLTFNVFFTIDTRSRQRKIELTTVISTLLYFYPPLLDTSARHALHRVGSLDGLSTLENGGIVPVAKHGEHIAFLCVPLSQSENACTVRRRMESSRPIHSDCSSGFSRRKMKLPFISLMRSSRLS